MTAHTITRLITRATALFAMAVMVGSCNYGPQSSSVPVRPFTFWLGGDVNLGHGGHHVLDNVTREMNGAEGIVNLEGPVSADTSGTSGGKLKVFNHPDSIKELHDARITVAGIVNNHMLDAGVAGTQVTEDALNANHVLPLGRLNYAVNIGMDAGHYVTVVDFDLTDGAMPPNLAQNLQSMSRGPDALVVMFHVTGPASYIPKPELKQAVQLALDGGAKVIVAHGTHALGPVERRGNAVIAWGLGNLVFDCDCTKEEDAMLLRVTVTQKDGPVQAEVVPIKAGLKGKPARLAPKPNEIFDLLESIGSTRLKRNGASATF